jgi:transcription-repair coupling factor (superfamily II helicase)
VLLEDSRNGSARGHTPSVEHAAVAAAIAVSCAARSLVIIAPTSTVVDRAISVVKYLLEFGSVPRDFPRWPSSVDSPYDPVIESPFVAASRLGALSACCLAENQFVLALDALKASRKVMPFDAFSDGIQRIQMGRELDTTELAGLLVRAGYRRTSTVAEVGEFALRNAVMDVYSPFHEDPFRIETDFDVVESLKVFDPATQRTRRSLDHAWVVPAWDVPSSEAALKQAGIIMRDAAAARGIPSAGIVAIEHQFSAGRTPPGFAAMLPCLYGSMDTPFDYVGDDIMVVVIDPDGCAAAADAAMDDLKSWYGEIKDLKQLAAVPADLAITGTQLIEKLKSRQGVLFIDIEPGEGILGPLHSASRSKELTLCTTSEVPVAERVAALVSFAREMTESGDGLLLLAPSESEARRVREILTAEGLDPLTAVNNGMAGLFLAQASIRVGVGRVKIPFGIDMFGVFVIPTESVFGVKDVLTGRQREKRNLKKIQEFRELTPGDLVIHRDHGMGIFEAMSDVTVDGMISECLVLTYKGGDRLYVPVDRINLLDKYSPPAEGEARVLDRLGTQAWVKRRTSAKGAARDIAQKLRNLYARRLSASAPAMTAPDNEYREFEATFPWETTADQEKAIEDILSDIQKTTPTDRLVCGDVGFGKTEVAIRAAFKTVSDGYQVAILVPTTILAEQHRLTFAARFRDTPVIVDSVSRFKSSKEIKNTLAALRTGGVDVVIGTHRLLSQDVKFANLGLLVIDEEHRFGVVHKERLREMSVGVHTITLTATPIPRTLHMALAGIRELSLITTPPRDRLAVRTYVARTGMEIIRTAILREIGRGGQVFVVHNRVEDIYSFASEITAHVPEARICVAHGQMTGPDLEAVMSEFVRGEKDVLIATTIIESGLDIGSANTMLIHDADRLGLAQLYQLRGRVGRSTEQAYCYLLVRDPSRLSDEARMRIEAIERFSELASGFNLASMDLAIRGGGDILGAEQSGHMAAVGEDMFMEMLRDAVMELSGEEVSDLPGPDVKVDLETRIPREYLPDERLRLRFYKRLSAAEEIADIEYVAAELVDRFGALPEAAANLVAMMRVKVRAAALQLAGLSLREETLVLNGFGGYEESFERIVAKFVAAGCVKTGVVSSGRAGLRVPAMSGAASGPDRLAVIERLLVAAV